MDDVTTADLVARLDALEARNSDLEARNAALERAVARLDAGPAAPTAPPVATEVVAIDRRRMLRTGLAAGAAAAAATVVGTASPAAAYTGETMRVGLDNNAPDETRICLEGPGLASDSVLVVTDISATSSVGGALIEACSGIGYQPTGVQVSGRKLSTGILVDQDTITNAFKGVHAKGGIGTGVHGDTTSGTAVQGTSTSGIAALFSSTSGASVQASSETGNGILSYSPIFQLYLGNLQTRQPPTTDAVAHYPGELVADSSGDLWTCVAGGTPGTWRKLAGPKATGAFHLLPAPARVYDSRPGTLPAVGPKTRFAANETRTFDLKVNSSTVPAGATGALVTLLLVNASTTPGNATIWANGVTKPLANTMVWGGTGGRFTATATSSLDTLARVQVNASQPTDLVVDVVGYYR